MENLYRYHANEAGIADMNRTERYVYFMSLATKTDLSDYFARWRFSVDPDNEPIFVEANASPAFQNLMDAARSGGKLTGEKLPFYYLESAEYNFIRTTCGSDVTKAALYDGTEKPNAPTVTRVSGGYSLLMPTENPKGDLQKHLGYEIWEGEEGKQQRIGFTTHGAFMDTTPYEAGYTPQYTIVGYDRALKHTLPSDSVGAVLLTDVCRIGETYFTTLGQAIDAAQPNDTIYITQDIADAGIQVTKPITIKADKDVTVRLSGAGPLFKANGSNHLTIISEAGKSIVLDGGNIGQTAPLLSLNDNAKLYMTGGTVQNSVNSSYAAVTGYGWYTDLYLNGVTFLNNRGVNGGAVYSHSLYTSIENCTFENNAATYGGCVYLQGGYCTLKNNTAKNNQATYGGFFCSDGCNRIVWGTYENNRATFGGAVCVRPAGYADVRTVTISGGAEFQGNTAQQGNIFYTANSGRCYLQDVTLQDTDSDGYFAYCDTGLFEIDGAKIATSDIAGKVYLSGATFSLQNRMLSGPFRIGLGVHSTDSPIVSTNFKVDANALAAFSMENEKYTLRSGEENSVYLNTSYRVTLDPQGGTITNRNLTGYIEGETTILPTSADIYKLGSTFVGWRENGSENPNTVKSIKPTDTGDKAYTAQWATTSFWVQYALNGGKFLNDNATQHYAYADSGSVDLPSSADVAYEDSKTKVVRDFLGWYKTSSLDKSKEYPDPVTSFALSEAKNLTFYAKWTCIAGDPVIENEKEPSCTEPGSYDEVVYCADKDCKKELSRKTVTVPAVEHSWGEWETYVTPGCTDPDAQVRRCSVCGAEETQNVNPEGHTPEPEFTVVTKPGCETDGLEIKRCMVCGIELAQHILPALGHDAGPVITENEDGFPRFALSGPYRGQCRARR